MANIAPFRALRYDPQRVSLSQVVTQPYDKITPAMQRKYYAASPYNLVRVILGQAQTGDNSQQNVYARAAASFHDWRRQGIFLQDAEPSLYVYSQRFSMPNAKVESERRGFIALGRVEDYPAGVVFRHEQTLAKPKADRLDLLRATRAHFGQIFMLYTDNGEIEALLSPDGLPIIEVTNEYRVLHRVWKVSDSGVINLIAGKMRDKKLIIADGHHRYETALNYRNERRSTAVAAATGAPRESSAETSLLRPNHGEDAPYEMVMMTFVNMNSPGLVILPTHRVVHGLASFSAQSLAAGARAYFTVDEIDASIDAPRAIAILREAGASGTALLAVTASCVYLMHSPKALGSQTFAGLSARQQGLDVVQLHKGLLQTVLKLSEESIRDQKNVTYVREAAEAMAQVRAGNANVAFLMNPARVEQVREIALSGEVMPQKSTDFYPKLLSGLTIYALE